MVDSSMSPWPQLTHTARNAEKCACRTSGDAFCRYAILACGVLEVERRVGGSLYNYFLRFFVQANRETETHSFLTLPSLDTGQQTPAKLAYFAQ